jgi:hypothetical protein
VAPRTIDEYVHWVVSEDVTLDKVDPEVKTQLETDYVQAIEDEITAALVNSLPEDKLDVAEKLLEHAPMPEVQDWMEEQVPDSKEIIAGILLRFRNNYLSANDVG